MSEHRATIRWQRGDAEFSHERYDRDHEWDFGHGRTLAASAAPEYLGAADRVDPEQAFVAALSSCHMLTFLALAAKRRFVVESYEDAAVGELGQNAQGRMTMTLVTLHPEVRFAPGRAPDEATLAQLHEKAHKYCFIANSVTTEVVVAG